MSDDEKWSRKEGKKDEDAADLPEAEALLIPEAFPIPEVEAAAPPPTGNVADPRPKKSSISWTISGDEAVNYGFQSIKEVLPYLFAIILCYAAAFGCFLLVASFTAPFGGFSSVPNTELIAKLFVVLSFIFLVVAILTQLSLMIGMGYKFSGDILLRAVRFHHLIEKKK